MTTVYRSADPALKRKIQALVVETYRPLVAAVVARHVPDPARHTEGRQVGAIGVLVALEKAGEGLSPTAVARHVRGELSRWQSATAA